jgi:hypothetical protein
MSSQPIRSAQSLKHIHLPAVNALSVNWGPYHAMALNARYLNIPHHPLHEQTKRRWYSRTDPFWWNILVSTKIGGKQKVVRGWLTSRARVAFKNALKNKGYAENGARLVKDSGRLGNGDLVGTAQIFVLPPLLHTGWKDLCNQTELMVAAIEKSQRQGNIQNRKERRLEAFGGSSQPQAVQFRRIST